MPCPVCAWFKENYPEEFAKWSKKGITGKLHDRAAWFLLIRVKELEAEQTAYVTVIHKLNAKLREHGMELP